MNTFQISWKNLKANRLTLALNLLLIAFGTGMLAMLLLGMNQAGERLRDNARGVDLVVGAKGSPLQLILSSIYFIDFPTGNISGENAHSLAAHPMVKKAVPLALGDNYAGFRIVGTDTGYVSLYGLELAAGRFWTKPFEIVIGADVARAQGLKAGDRIYGSHGLTSDEDLHDDHPYVVAGVLKQRGSVADNLVLTSLESVWQMHGADGAREITSMLLQYRSRMAMAALPATINRSTAMQAASPAKESARLFALIGIGVDAVRWFAIALMLLAGVSVFVSLYNSLRERVYDLAVMRVMGASSGTIFAMIVLEGTLLTTLGSFAGILLGHGALHAIGYWQGSPQARMDGLVFLPEEGLLLAAGLFIGLVAALLPAIQAYRTDISETMSKI
ncbi:putative ABC transport system permease protein [Dyadobacter sp. BE34]|uniref:ABC transport system permease protein n=1 Tax=Dyadobacter fermentans TaxID=94254 RepID=A0ABU1R5H2_9BACT|nr:MULTISPECIES: ABC transporter permease [Dyadobacter]MDR6808651.1 putative ABC transport system permease protein [Dyadobacter fermentans]MDR7046394.1 putative ABC transport system permease protein [Dyadobacter sp. BE242]MDR7200707.1 putative ABC transport system permease protein [Dyadobacter sp. BE34]MDR7218667.1 putative ABC transport system permease protein [Dyadobacter sp. BE31]MDR7266597.1 putative ABC transport system permease protein [Dyadobacter sp. BE32]